MFWLRVALGLAVYFAVLIGVLFGAAGRWDIPMFWAYFGVQVVTLLLALVKADRELMQERWKPGPGGKDHALRWLGVAVLLLQLVVAGMDVGRYHWSDSVPRWMQIAGLVLIAAAIGLSKWATTVNRFFSSVVRIQRDRGHHLVDSGPYAYIRHPGYLAAMTWFVMSGVALGSWLAVGMTLPGVLLVLRRLFLEERVLLAELEGYREYAQRVRWRLIPRVW